MWAKNCGTLEYLGEPTSEIGSGGLEWEVVSRRITFKVLRCERTGGNARLVDRGGPSEENPRLRGNHWCRNERTHPVDRDLVR